MSSILTNLAATSALKTLRGVNSALQATQSQVSSGLRVAKASDDTAYWSISTSMKSDRSAISAVSDVLGLGSAKIDTAYAGMDSVVDILGEFKAKLIAAKEDAVDKTKIQAELDQLKQQILSTAQSASFNGENLLDTNISDIHDRTMNQASVVSSFTRNASGGVSVGTISFGLDQISLFNSSGGGILQADPRDMKTIGGLRYDLDGSQSVDMSTFAFGNEHGWYARQDFTFTGPITLGPSDSINFDVTVDADDPSAANPDDQLPGPYEVGKTTSISIDSSTVNAALGRTDGKISTFENYATVLNYALTQAGSGASAYNSPEYYPYGQTNTWRYIPNLVSIATDEDSGLDGSSIQISNLSSTVSTSGLADTQTTYGERRSAMTLDFEQFQVYEGVVVSFSLDVDNTSTSYSFDKDYVDKVLGETSGSVATSGDMSSLLNSLINRSDVLISATSPSEISVKTDVNQDRLQGAKSAMEFTGVSVNIEPLPTMDFENIDITGSTSGGIDGYIDYIEIVSKKAIQGAAVLGSLKNSIDGQMDFAAKLGDSIDSGVGRLVDTDMEAASAKLSAEQTQQQLAVQSLSIANQAPQTILSLFKN